MLTAEWYLKQQKKRRKFQRRIDIHTVDIYMFANFPAVLERDTLTKLDNLERKIKTK